MIRTTMMAAILATGTTAGTTVGTATAQAQDITIGNSNQIVGAALREAGFGPFRILERELARTIVETCRADLKYIARVDLLGRVRHGNAQGPCDLAARGAPVPQLVQAAGPLTAPRLNQRLTRAGFTDVEARPVANGRFVADACRNDQRLRMRFAPTGERLNQRVVGRCSNGRLVAGTAPAQPAANREVATPRQIRQQLRARGYRDIRFTDRELPRYAAEVCNGKREKLELRMNRFGEVQNARKVGDCAPLQAANQPAQQPSRPARQNPQQANRDLDPAKLAAQVEKLGFTNVQVTLGRPIQATACRRESRYEMTLNRVGEIVNQTLAGDCRERIAKAALETRLRGEGYSRLVVTERPRGYNVVACNGVQKVAMNFNPFGDVTERNVSGQCESQTVAEVVSTLRGRGARQLEVVLEGCFRDSRYRWRFNQLGDRLGRERIGACQ